MVLISLVIDGRIFTHKVLVVDDLSHDVILGKDFLEPYKSKTRFRTLHPSSPGSPHFRRIFLLRI